MRPPSIFKVAPGVTGLRTVMVNLYLVASRDKGWVLVDGGLRGGGDWIVEEATKLFGKNNPPQAIVLTHGHFDHTGGLPAVLKRWQVPLYAHAGELPYLNGDGAYPPPDPTVGGGAMALSSVLFSRHATRLHQPVLALPDNGAVPGLPDWRWIPTPGHSPGHVSLWREADRVLLSGDALVTTHQESVTSVWTQRKEVHPPPAYFTCDWQAAYDSMRRLQALEPKVLASGHGLPLRGDDWRREMDVLIAEFPRRGLPRHGHYVRTTWSTPFAA